MELLRGILKAAVEGGASDIHIKVGTPVVFRINRQLVAIEAPMPTEQWMSSILEKMVPPHARKRIEEDREVDFSYFEPGVGRFRTNVFQQRGTFALAMRYVKTQVPSFEELGLLPVLKQIALSPRGIVLVAGTTGSGKSTTLAAMLEHINANFKKHIVTLESAVEELRSTLAADRQRLTESEAAVRQLKSRADESARLNEIQAETSALAQKQAAAAAAELERKADECLSQKRAIDKLERALGDAEESASAQRKRAELEVQLQLRTVLSDGERACADVSARLAREQAENARLAERARSLEEALLKMTHARDAADEERAADRARVGRQLSDAVQELEEHRTKSAAHEQQWHEECESGMRRHSSPVGQPRGIVRA